MADLSQKLCPQSGGQCPARQKRGIAGEAEFLPEIQGGSDGSKITCSDA